MSERTSEIPDDVGADAEGQVALASELRIVVSRVMRGLRSAYTFSLTQAGVLGRLERDGPQYIGELAAAEHVRPQSMSQTLAELEVEGLIVRSPDASDGRRTVIDLTPDGRRAVFEERARRDGWLAEMIATFTPEEQRILTQAIPLLERLAQR